MFQDEKINGKGLNQVFVGWTTCLSNPESHQHGSLGLVLHASVNAGVGMGKSQTLIKNRLYSLQVGFHCIKNKRICVHVLLHYRPL